VTRYGRLLLVAAWSMIASGCGGSHSLTTGPEVCAGGVAGDFSCSGINLRKRVSLATMQGTGGSDIWGWFDAQTGNEYALMGMTDGSAFVDDTDPEEPLFLGKLPTATG